MKMGKKAQGHMRMEETGSDARSRALLLPLAQRLASIHAALGLETSADRIEKSFLSLHPRPILQDQLEALTASLLTHVMWLLPAAITFAWTFIGLGIPASFANHLPPNVRGWVVIVYLCVYGLTLKCFVAAVHRKVDRLLWRILLNGFSRWVDLCDATPMAFATGTALRLAVQLENQKSKPVVLRKHLASGLDMMKTQFVVFGQRYGIRWQRGGPPQRKRRWRGAAGADTLNAQSIRQVRAFPSTQLGREDGFWVRQLQRQSAATAAAIGALTSTGAAVLKVGAGLTALATISGATLSADLLRRFGVNLYDYVSITDLPALGLRFFPDFALTFGFFGALAVWSAVSAWRAAHAVQSHRETVARTHPDNAWRRIGTWLSASLANKDGYLMPGLVTVSCFIVIEVALPTATDLHSGIIGSKESCTHFVTWQKDAWPADPPFLSTECAVLLGVMGSNMVFVVGGDTHVIPKEKVAAMKIKVARERGAKEVVADQIAPNNGVIGEPTDASKGE